jgi:AraC family transcriptional regulator
MTQEQPLLYIKNPTTKQITSEQIYPVSSNNDEYILLYVTKGQGTVFYDTDFLGIKQYDLIIIDLHKDFYYSSDDMDIMMVTIGGPLVKKILPKETIFTIQNHQEFQATFHMLIALDYNQLYSLLKQTMALIDFLHDHHNQYTLKKQEHPMQRSIRYIEDHFNHKLEIEDIAKWVGFSKYHFIRKFKAYTNSTPYQYILHMRLEHSKYLLRHTKKPIQKIAKESGFQGEISYINCFTTHTNQTPTTYRRTKES